MFINRVNCDQNDLVLAMEKMSNLSIPNYILNNAKNIILSYKGTVMDTDFIVSSLIDQVMGRGNAFIPEKIEFDKIEWEKIYEETRTIIRAIFSDVKFGESVT